MDDGCMSWAFLGEADRESTQPHRKSPAILGIAGLNSGGLLTNLLSRAIAGLFSGLEEFILSKRSDNPFCEGVPHL